METNKRLLAIVDRFAEARILVVGDMMLDRFIWGTVTRISPEAPVPVVDVTRESAHLGGSANVVSNISALGGCAIPVGLVGEDEAGLILRAKLTELGVVAEGLVVDSGFQTIQKTRIIAHQQQVVRVDREIKQPLSDHNLARIEARLKTLAVGSDALILSDYGKGVITPPLLAWLAPYNQRLLISVDPKDRNFPHYHGFGVITPNKAEAERMSGIAITDGESLQQAAAAIFARLACRNLLITLGEQGMALFPGPREMITIPTKAREVYDVSGAGDTVIATYTLASVCGATPHEAALLANAAAGVVVAKIGTATLTPEELRTALG